MTVRIPMKYSEIPVSSADDLIGDPSWVLEQKLDGTRALAVVTATHMRFLHSGGGQLAHTAATQHLAEIRKSLVLSLGTLADDDEIVLDGEILTGPGTFHVFDLPFARVGQVHVQQDDALMTRRSWLQVLVQPTHRLHIVRQARTSDEKDSLFSRAMQSGAEGVMAKRNDSPYMPGARTKTSVKLKFVKSADVIVTGVNRPDARHGSFTLAVQTPDGDLVPIGGCSAIGKDPETKVGDVIEINYLYFTGSSVYQPRMVRRRPDKAPHECGLDQFPVYSRDIL